MEHRIEELKEKQLIGKKMTMSFAANTTAELWRSFMLNCKKIPHGVGQELYSIQQYPPDFFKVFNPATSFEKWAAMEVSYVEYIPQDMEIVIVAAGTYAVFLYKGPAHSALPFQYIFQSWLPASGYELDTRPHFEVIGEKYSNHSEDSEEEIWIPVRKKDEKD